jgi:hypothetical protein
MLASTSVMLMRWNVRYRMYAATPAISTLAAMPSTFLIRLRRGSGMAGFQEARPIHREGGPIASSSHLAADRGSP